MQNIQIISYFIKSVYWSLIIAITIIISFINDFFAVFKSCIFFIPFSCLRNYYNISIQVIIIQRKDLIIIFMCSNSKELTFFGSELPLTIW